MSSKRKLIFVNLVGHGKVNCTTSAYQQNVFNFRKSKTFKSMITKNLEAKHVFTNKPRFLHVKQTTMNVQDLSP